MFFFQECELALDAFLQMIITRLRRNGPDSNQIAHLIQALASCLYHAFVVTGRKPCIKPFSQICLIRRSTAIYRYIMPVENWRGQQPVADCLAAVTTISHGYAYM